jgi:hypothetical protein
MLAPRSRTTHDVLEEAAN